MDPDFFVPFGMARRCWASENAGLPGQGCAGAKRAVLKDRLETAGRQKRNQEKKLEKVLDKKGKGCYTNKAVSDDGKTCGGVAHLGERLHGMQEVRGSIPLISTKNRNVLSTARSDFFV